MELGYVPLLEEQRRLYAMPRGFDRFREYVRTMTAGGDDMELPLPAFNPMGKDAAAASLDGWIASGGDEAGAAATAEVGRRLAGAPGSLRVGVVLADDAAGGWTNREATEAANRFDARGTLRRGWAVGLVWTSDEPRTDTLRKTVMAAIYRTAHARRFGMPRTLSEAMRQEGRAAAFAGHTPVLDPEDVQYSREVIEPHRDADAHPIIMACLYGDDVARQLGYSPQGLSARAGYEVALDLALAEGRDPAEHLAAVGVGS